MNLKRKLIFNTSALRYFVYTFIWSILFWGLAYIFGGDDSSSSILFYVGGAGPFVIAILLTLFKENTETKRDFWIRIIDIKRIRWPWLFASLILHPILILIAFLIDGGLGGAFPGMSQQLSSITSIFSFLFFVFLLGPFPEEIGWRGFALDRLQLQMSAVKASLILGGIWALWHVPLFFIPGTFQSEVMGLGTLRFWIFLFSNIPLSIIMAWVYNNTNRSTLSVALIHFSGNVFGALYLKSDRVALLELLLLIIFAIFIASKYGLDEGSVH